MTFSKLAKNSAYYSRYQTKYKRRRSGKTDYYARKRLITQAKNKYNAPKYRLVVRFTNRDIVMQIVTSEITGDKVFCAAYSHELKAYGIDHGLTNWAAAYCTGLLIARRVLKKLGMDEDFTGVEEADGEYQLTEAAGDEERRPFKAFLDVGLQRTSTGARIFGAMKGASDGGILVPHSENRFPGYDMESKELDAETLRKYIFGGHIAEYMETLADDDEERYKSQFQGYVDDEIEADGLEELYQEAHKNIREDPFKKVEGEKKTKEEYKTESLKFKGYKLSKDEKRERVKVKIAALKTPFSKWFDPFKNLYQNGRFNLLLIIMAVPLSYHTSDTTPFLTLYLGDIPRGYIYTMEQMTGVDVSWMTHSSSNKDLKRPRMVPNVSGSQGKSSPTPQNGSTPSKNKNENELATTPQQIPTRSGVPRNASSEKIVMANGTPPKASTAPNMSRRNSWLSSISSKFTGTHPSNLTSASPSTSPAAFPIDPPIQRPAGPSAPKNAVLVHGVKEDGDAPYVPAPPRSGPSFLQSALRRLSSSSGQLSGSAKGHNGLCERKILNVDPHRERCPIFGLEQSKLRRVAFCVDVEIASGARYIDEEDSDEADNKSKEKPKRSKEKGEGAALKNPNSLKAETEQDDVSMTKLPTLNENLPESTQSKASKNTSEGREISPPPEKDNSKKKEKKKRSEEERKARKEKKRKLAEANGTIPVELKIDESDSSLSTLPNTATPKTHASPTTDPVRIYRRCCQLRETPILKRIVEQLTASVATATTPGLVDKLDLSSYWLQLPDLVTLGDYLAVVPVRELAMENCGLTDEGVRVILAGLLAAKLPTYGRKTHTRKDSQCSQGGIIERLVLKNNSKIGKDGWRHISLFINMCRSLKTLDLSRIPFPQSVTTPPASGSGDLKKIDSKSSNTSTQVSCLLSRAIGDRLAGPNFELLNLGHCGLNSQQLDGLVDGIIKSGLRRLGLAGNEITSVGMEHVARWIRYGNCEGLDLGCNDLRDSLETISNALDEDNKIYALSLADCNLNPDSLWPLFPALAKLKNFKFIDLSQNHDLFESKPSALSLLRRYLPRLPQLKRIHLTDVSMTPEQAIALAEILPESPSLAHVTLMENTQLAALANAKDEASQEEACALYASLMAAVRVSESIVCIDIEVPSSDSSEIVKALAKQVVAYCLWNMERGPVAEISGAVAAISDPHIAANGKDVAVPEVLLHIVGHIEGVQESPDDDEPAPDEDYVIGGTGVVKALGICLRNKGNDSRRPSADRTFSDLSRPSSRSAAPNPAVKSGKAKDMSKNLLGSARKIRARLQPALVKESKASDHQNYNRLLFLDHTLQNMIKRFEDEYPETRLSPSLPDTEQITMTEDTYPLQTDYRGLDVEPEPVLVDNLPSDEEGGHDEGGIRPTLSRHNSDVSLASRALSQEEGRMHRFGQKIRRNILKPEGEDNLHGTTGHEIQPAHLQFLRSMVEDLQGEDIRNKIEAMGPDAVIAELNNETSILRQRFVENDPEGWHKFEESQEAMQRNSFVANLGSNGNVSESAIE
ncbi:hypothetical protein SBOR_7352 [Sclerotinia borealis F-4128]|uniref:Large ribosomal subunit protein uL18 C-terminal eukaryotes domain-containing protein n=1 Tax=Sclerotinia borealis (strain F-4128) TaxID=1432307 RepID=W9C8X8_SCLBF|nr:hypothetical protein SBOR_7352 [Sclerotinia borealis F-4128]